MILRSTVAAAAVVAAMTLSGTAFAGASQFEAVPAELALFASELKG